MINNNRKFWLAAFLVLTLTFSLGLIVLNFFEGYNELKIGLSIFLFLTITLLIGVALAVKKNLERLIIFFEKIAEGKTPEKVKIVGEMFNRIADSGLLLTAHIRKASQFAKKIGEGNFDHSFKALNEHDTLGNALIQMKEKLESLSQEEQRQNWANEGEAQFAKLLRSSDDRHELADLIISYLVKYLNANQGALYVVNEEALQMEACYAYNRKKYLNRKIDFGEGLIGQAYLEGDYIHLSEVPQNYINITSGIGEAPPREILIMPLKVNDQIQGILELASFNKFSPYMIEFLRKTGESLAASIAAVKTAERTKRLLQASTEQQEQLRAQEEEMRQNMEEMQATQEEAYRKAKTFEEQLAQKELEIERLKAELAQNTLTERPN